MNIILAAIDGTMSWTYFRVASGGEFESPLDLNGNGSGREYNRLNFSNRSFTYKFYDDCDVGLGGSKEYFEGPDLSGSGMMSGSSADQIVVDVIEFLTRELAIRVRPIVLVGHSRGGHIAVTVARRLYDAEIRSRQPQRSQQGPPTMTRTLRQRARFRFPVMFIGLYDAVDRHAGGQFGSDTTDDSDSIPQNVSYAAHARRDPNTASRWWFGNTAMQVASSADTVYVPQTFLATHGRMGGYPAETTETCTMINSHQLTGDCTAISLPATLQEAEGNNAHSFILDQFEIAKRRFETQSRR